MRFTLIGPVYPYRGGIAHFSTELAQALRAKHAVQVISFKRQYPQWLYPGESDRDPSQQARKIEAAYLLDSLNPLSWGTAAHSAISQNPDAVIMQWWTTFFAPMNIIVGNTIRHKGIPLTYVVHNVFPHEPRPWDMMLSRLVLGKADFLLSLSHREQHRLEALFPDREIGYVPLPVYTHFTDREISQAEARRQLGLPANAMIVLFFGLVRPYKGLQTLLESFVLLRQRNAAAHLLIAGEFWEDMTPYINYIQEHGLAPQVTLHARYIPDEQVATYFGASDAFAAPYRSATQSAALKTAMGFGLPIAASEAVLEDAETPEGYPVFAAPAKQPEAFVIALQHALQATRVTGEQKNGWDDLVRVLERA